MKKLALVLASLLLCVALNAQTPQNNKDTKSCDKHKTEACKDAAKQECNHEHANGEKCKDGVVCSKGDDCCQSKKSKDAAKKDTKTTKKN